jgi:DNA polymerase III delta prime subunit
MTTLNIHTSILDKLKYFQEIHKIPNIIFHGPSGSGKKTIVNDFINLIYTNDKTKIKSFVMYVNCAHGKGIKFIRDELKFFAKTHINSNGGDNFKSIILLNADKLTTDAQSALRRCIELFSHNTRFFIIVEDKYKLLKPILSRFCEIHIPEPTINGVIVDLYTYNLNRTFNLKEVKNKRMDWLKNELNKVKLFKEDENYENLILFSEKLYEKGYSGLDIVKLLENHLLNVNLTDEKIYELLFTFNKVKKELRNEKILIMFILYFLYLSLNHTLENISFI